MKLIEVLADAGNADTVASIAETHHAVDFRLAYRSEDEWQTMRILVSDDQAQGVLDKLHTLLGTEDRARIIVLPVETTLPRPSEAHRKEEDRAGAMREKLYDDVERGVQLDTTYIALVLLSTVVAVLGLSADNVAVVIGAMVIAPLLGPNLALALSTALGDISLMKKSLKTNLVGLSLTVAMSIVIGVFMPPDLTSAELLARTDVGLDSVALALASGAAATLSLSTGLSTVLVGVMVAVALLPPAATLGLMLGGGHPDLATGAALLLAVNVVSVNLAAKTVFLLKGLRPRTWWEREKARQATIVYMLFWLVTLLILVLAIYWRHAWLA